MAPLDDLSGYEFEDLVEDVFRNLGYENVRQTERTGDEGRDVRTDRYGQTETGYKEWVVERLRDHHTATVHYTGDNNVDYDKTCRPNQSDVSVRSIRPVYLPQLRTVATFHAYEYPYEYYNAGPSRLTIEDGVRQCVHCGDDDARSYTYCDNCGSINCGSHVRTERLEGTPVCTGCAVTERFSLRTKYFYDEGNLEAFREEYDANAPHEKALENKPLVAGTAVVVLVVAVAIATGVGPL